MERCGRCGGCGEEPKWPILSQKKKLFGIKYLYLLRGIHHMVIPTLSRFL